MTTCQNFFCSAPRAFARAAALCALLMLTLAGGLRAQDFEGRPISKVEIKFNGPQTVSEARIRNMMGSKAGTPYSTEKLDGDVKTLLEDGFVDDVRVFAEDDGEQVKLTVEVSTRAEYVAVGFVGNTVFNDRTLIKETKLKPRGILSDSAILEARRNIEKYYFGYGYPDVTVEHRIQDTAREGKKDLVFVIDEGSKNEIRKIRFEGVTVFTDAELKKEMKTKPKNWLSWLTKAGRFQTEQLDTDLDAILDYYKSKGYLRVSSPGIRREPVGDGRVDIVIPIVEGAKYTVASVGFANLKVFKPEELQPALTLLAGDAYSSKKMRADITMIRSYYGARGYADAMPNPDIRDAGPSRVSITYRMFEGSRYRVNKVNIKVRGNPGVTKDKVIRSEVTLKPGDWFNSVELDTTRSRLNGLRYFSDVQVSDPPASAGYRDVDILVEDTTTGSAGVGMGFSSIDSIVGFLNVEQANFDLFAPGKMFRGGGQRFGLNVRVGSERSDFSLTLVEPRFLDRELRLGTELFYHQSTYFSDWYEQKNAGASVWLAKRVGTFDTLRLEYRIEQVDVDVYDSTPNGSKLRQEDGDYLRSALALNYIYDSRDDNVMPRSGSKLDAGLTYAGVGGDVDALTFSLQAQKHWNLKWDSILTLSGELAAVDGSEVPIFERLYLGGGRTLRGFEFRDVGPRDAAYPTGTGDVIGGQSLGYMTVEYTYPIIETIRLAAFYDMGFVNADSWDFDPSALYGDAGIGVRMKLPISPLPLALDYAFPLFFDDDRADNGGQFNFYMLYNY